MKQTIQSVVNVIFMTLFAMLPFTTIEAAETQLELFEGGNMEMKILLRSSLFNAPGTTTALRGNIAPVVTNPYVMFGNPAAMGLITESQFTLGLAPGFEYLANKMYNGFDETIEEEVDGALESFTQTSDPVYPVVNAYFGRNSGGVDGLALVLPIRPDAKADASMLNPIVDRIGIGYHQNLGLNVSMILSGLRMRIRNVEDDPDNNILMYTTVKMDANIALTGDKLNLSAAKRFGNLWTGVTVGRSNMNLLFAGSQRTDGIMSKSELESAFNDSRDPWDNDYYSRMLIDVHGSRWFSDIGLLWVPAKWVNLGFTFSSGATVEMEGTLDFAKYTFPALNPMADTDAGEENFDVNKIEDVSEMTRTYPTEFTYPEPMKINVPSSMSFGVGFNVPMKPTLTFTTYSGEASYELLLSENGTERMFKRGVQPKYSAGISISMGFVISAGMTSVDEVVEGHSDTRGYPFPPKTGVMIPNFSLGWEMAMTENVQLGLVAFALPEDLLRLSLTYRF